MVEWFRREPLEDYLAGYKEEERLLGSVMRWSEEGRRGEERKSNQCIGREEGEPI